MAETEKKGVSYKSISGMCVERMLKTDSFTIDGVTDNNSC